MPAWITPLDCPVWPAAIPGSRSSTATRRPAYRRASSRAAARPTIPAPTTTTSHSPGGSADFACTCRILADWRDGEAPRRIFRHADMAAASRRRDIRAVDVRRQIVAFGGGGFSMESGNPLLDDYVLELTGVTRPRVC